MGSNNTHIPNMGAILHFNQRMLDQRWLRQLKVLKVVNADMTSTRHMLTRQILSNHVAGIPHPINRGPGPNLEVTLSH